ncbi:MAG: ABC transporter permease [Lachnospiraceae bacterium]|nr:ABC transporter permease [Lachnospiraceae bacterium]MBR1876484.1 ABC transporter permease [Lachnospiraceae bacterium]
MVDKLTDFISRFYVAIIAVFLYAPIAVLIVLSFNKSRSRVVWEGFTLDWYISLIHNRQIQSALMTTLALAFLSAFISLIIGTAAALGISSMKRRSHRTMMVLTNIPMLNADIVTGIALMLWMIQFMPLGFNSVLLSHITFNIPYVILAVLPKVKMMNLSIYNAGRDLGAGPLRAFFMLILPQLKDGMLSGFFMAFTMSMDDFVITYFTKGAGVNTLSTMIYGEIRKGIKPEMYALSTIIFTVVFGVLLVANGNTIGTKERKRGYE